MINWSRWLFGKKPDSDVPSMGATSPLDPEIERERDILGLQLLRQVVLAAEVSATIRQRVADQAVTKLHGRL